MPKYTNFFEDFDIPCYGERNINNPSNVKKILERIKILEDKNTTEAIKRNFIEKFGPIEDQIKVLNEWLDKYKDEEFLITQADICFQAQYKKFKNLVNQFESKYVYLDDLNRMIQLFKKNLSNPAIKFDLDRALEIMDYIYPFTGKVVAIDFEKFDEDLVRKVASFQMEYKRLRRELNSLKLNANNTVQAIYDYLDLQCVNSPQTVLYKLELKENLIEEQTHQGNEGQLIEDIRTYYDASIEEIRLFEFMVRVWDLEVNEVIFQKYKGMSLPDSAYKIYRTLVDEREDHKFIQDYFAYQSKKYGFTYELSNELKSLKITPKKICSFCEFEYYPEDHHDCPKCGLEDEKAQEINQAIIDGFRELQNRDVHKVYKQDQFLKPIFRNKRKYASPKMKKAYEDFTSAYARLRKELSHRRKIFRRIATFILLLIIGAFAYIYITSYQPFEKEWVVEDVYIYNQSDFMKLYEQTILNDNYYLMSDISFYDNEIAPIGTAKSPFKGKFFGNGYTLMNFILKTEGEMTSLFNYNEGLIENVNIKNMQVIGSKHTATFVGINKGEIKNISLHDINIEYGELNSTFVFQNEGSIANVYIETSGILNQDQFLSGFALFNDGEIVRTYAKTNLLNLDSGIKYNVNPFTSTISEGSVLENNYLNSELSTHSYSIPEGVNFVTITSSNLESFMSENLQWSTDTWKVEEGHYVVKVIQA